MSHRRLSISRLGAALAVAAALLVLLIRPLPSSESAALALCLAAIGLWATGAIPEYVTAIAFFTLAMLFKIGSPGVIFGGFESAAWWLIFGGLIMGVAVKTTGLGERIARRLARSFGGSYWGVITGVTVVGVTLGFVMPSSMGRAVLLMPIALSLAGRFGFAPGSKGRTGIVLAAAFGCHVPTFSILPANVPNMVLVGAAETAYRYVPTYGTYLLLHFPVLGFLKTAIMVPLIVWLCPDRPQPAGADIRTPLRNDERWLAMLLIVALAFWMTDSLHHVSPAWVSMAAALLLLAPGFGLVGRKAFGEQINYGSLFYVAGIMGLGSLVDKSGLGGRLADAIVQILPLAPSSPIMNFASLSAVSTVVGLATTLPGVPAVLTPLAAQMAQASGLPLDTILMSQVLGFSNPILPYESAPLVVAMQLGGERMGPAQILCLLLAVITIVFLLPINFLWWRLLGWI
ncbi:SLC13 family permease [Telmatospirillum siberiense]|uniref:Sodium:sulfate symporter n=1 Tax=Telmatospirillum siberiense TaxID=382514 RepID=A0A2N3PYB9_9PROT|nr:SLC13 family permease [Telmatospirillum siberiense]PKU25383.1 sodium:sulfate symporter [Telmatospirillum siberiense]